MGDSDAPLEAVRARYDWTNTAPSIAIVDAIAAVEDVESTSLPEALGTTLFDHVDPEALDALVAGERRVAISFAVGEYRIRIDGNDLTITRD